MALHGASQNTGKIGLGKPPALFTQTVCPWLLAFFQRVGFPSHHSTAIEPVLQKKANYLVVQLGSHFIAIIWL